MLLDIFITNLTDLTISAKTANLGVLLFKSTRKWAKQHILVENHK